MHAVAFRRFNVLCSSIWRVLRCPSMSCSGFVPAGHGVQIMRWGMCRYVRMYEDPGEPESSMQPEWEIDPADLVIGVKARACWCPVQKPCTPSALPCSLCSMMTVQSHRGPCFWGRADHWEAPHVLARPAAVLQCSWLRWRPLRPPLLEGELGFYEKTMKEPMLCRWARASLGRCTRRRGTARWSR